MSVLVLKHGTWTDISSTIKGEIEPPIREFNEIILDFLSFFQSRRIDKIGCTKLPGPRFFFWVYVDCNDATRSKACGGIDDTQANCTTPEYTNRRPLCVL